MLNGIIKVLIGCFSLTSALAVHCVLTPVPFAHMPLLVHATQPAVAETTSLSDVGFGFVY